MLETIEAIKYTCDMCGAEKYEESELAGIPNKWVRGATRCSLFCESCSHILQEVGYNLKKHTFDKTPTLRTGTHGHWIHRGSGLDTCSVCNFTCGRYDDDTMDECCSHCGAKMDGCVCK